MPDGTEGAIWLRGTVLDGEREPIPDALIETWQADPAGSYETPGFRGFGRCPTRCGRHVGDPHGQARRERRPGAAHRRRRCSRAGCCTASSPGSTSPTRRRPTPPTRCSRGLDEAARATLIAAAEGDGYRFDVRLQGADETVFFAV